MIEWVTVNSTAIRKVGYELETSTMHIDFENSDPAYTFCNVPESIFRELINAQSIGKYYNLYIKGKYNC